MHPKKRIRIETGARLHFGLLGTSAPFGGLGVMTDQPSTIVEFSSSGGFTVDDAIRDRAVPIVKRLCLATDRSTLPDVTICVLQTAPSHSGFGSGTQLSLAIAEGLCLFLDEQLPHARLACEIADRGKRSAVGVHGYFHGGLIFESQGECAQPLNPVQVRVELPASWRLVLLRPTTNSFIVSGDLETQQFARLKSDCGDSGGGLRKQVTNEILPAAEAKDFEGFAHAVESYNHASGMLFAEAQGGPYNGEVVTNIIASLKSHGATGVGQSSWGPGVFAWCKDESSARSLASHFSDSPVNVLIAKVKQGGRQVRVLK